MTSVLKVRESTGSAFALGRRHSIAVGWKTVFGLAMAFGLVVAGEKASHAADDAFDFKGTRWKVTQLGPKDVGMAGDLHFDRERVDGASACNFFGGRYEFSGENGLTISVDRVTRKGCSGEALDLERGYLEALSKVQAYAFGDAEKSVLELKGEDGAVVARLQTQETFALEGTRLKVVSYLFEEGLYNVNPGTKPTLYFADGKIKGDTGCTRFTGTYTLTEATVKVVLDQPLSKAETCPPKDVRQDKMVLENLQAAARFDTGRNLIRLLHPEKDWAMLWIAKDFSAPAEPGKAE
ncbi:MAG: META domain-containing protein [Pseudomonadota bacterium]